jgi:hypothetical protein
MTTYPYILRTGGQQMNNNEKPHIIATPIECYLHEAECSCGNKQEFGFYNVNTPKYRNAVATCPCGKEMHWTGEYKRGTIR